MENGDPLYSRWVVALLLRKTFNQPFDLRMTFIFSKSFLTLLIQLVHLSLGWARRNSNPADLATDCEVEGTSTDLSSRWTSVALFSYSSQIKERSSPALSVSGRKHLCYIRPC